MTVDRAALIDAAEAAIHRADCGCDGSLEPGGDDYRRMGAAAVAAVLPLIAASIEAIPIEPETGESITRDECAAVVRSFAGEAS